MNSIAKNILAIFDEKLEIRERCKGVHCVDLDESFPTRIYLQKSASIQPRTSPVKFARSPCTDPPGGSPAAVRLPEQNEGQGADPENVKTNCFCSGFLDLSFNL